ncbi:hypothetical protein QJS83_04440 [Bdellovibrio sp. 22V]|uniref:hypothetical protein n=1 Tax=Bdellovibrio TaxID=958 RepID=UPI0025433CDD|nr:hypothetical protein [Bdellovibrio sp. 22V]WII73120.1 hypothetical protein QJS83_04440 [Bdellovibrio sp. 22V]
MDTQALQTKFNEFSGALKEKFGNIDLSQDELRKAMTSPDEFAELVSEKTGLPKEECNQKVHQVMDSLHIDDATAKGFMAKFSDTIEKKYDQFKSKFTHH